MPPWQKHLDIGRRADNPLLGLLAIELSQTSPSHYCLKRGAFVHLQSNRIDVAHPGQFLVRMNGSVDDLPTHMSGLG